MTMLTRRQTLTLIGGTVLSAPFVKKARAAGSLNIYNWAEYMGETTIEDFQSATGISVVYDTYASAEELVAKMLAGSTGYDLVMSSYADVPILMRAKLTSALDKQKLTNWGNLDTKILSLLEAFDPGNNHAVPYMFGTSGLAFNVDLVRQRLPDADLSSLDILLKPENASKLADCGISILDSPMDVLSTLLYYLGKDPQHATEADFRAAGDLLKNVRKSIKTFDNVNVANAAASQEVCVFNVWSGNYVTAQNTARQAGLPANFEYHVPKTGADMWIDTWTVPADAANKDNAHAFLNYLLEPEVIAKCTNFLNYANPNLAATKFVDKAIAENPAIYVTPEVMSRLHVFAFTDEQKRIITRVWTDVKAG